MSRAAGPRVPVMAGNGAGVWVVLLIGWGLAAAAWLAWLAARIAAALAGRHVPPFGEHWVISLARGRTGQTWPGTPTVLVAADRRRAGLRRHHGRDHGVAGHRRRASRGPAIRWPRSPSTRRSGR